MGRGELLSQHGGAAMTPTQSTEIQRRARTDATARMAGWPVHCPFHKVDEATQWRKEFDLALKESKEKAK